MQIELVDFAPATKANPYAEHVATLAAAGEGKALAITVPAGTKRPTDEQKAAGLPGDSANGQKDRLLFQKAANEAGHTARLRSTEDVGNGMVKLTFTLSELHKRGSNKPATEEAPAPEQLDTVQDMREHVSELPAEETPAVEEGSRSRIGRIRR